ncbi:MAG TPA: MTH1187 family thiamine-binding protein [Deltaproteobacteria bacterium]|nr:MTH1187 family thiamine-binding protein [Deltaproteobacteria bacterium]
MLVEFSVAPLGAGESLSAYVAPVMKLIDESGLPYKAGPMGTVVEGEWDEVMALVKRCHHEILKEAPRVLTSIRIDDRPGRPAGRLTEKVRSVEKRLGRELRK